MTQPEALRLADLIQSRYGNDINDEAATELRRLAGVEQQRDELLEALERSRAQWIHSVNADRCLAAIAKAQQ